MKILIHRSEVFLTTTAKKLIVLALAWGCLGCGEETDRSLEKRQPTLCNMKIFG